ncbi:hypothetical protein LBMAG31_05390 [Nitrosomonadaceae bacterium]|nr:hypothetical protein LBMAG31_05390 [Nitrosomonadaceae bacterium]
MQNKGDLSNLSYAESSCFISVDTSTCLQATADGTQRWSSIEKMIEDDKALHVEERSAHHSLDNGTKGFIGVYSGCIDSVDIKL